MQNHGKFINGVVFDVLEKISGKSQVLSLIQVLAHVLDVMG
jgi:hypothetical protein